MNIAQVESPNRHNEAGSTENTVKSAERTSPKIQTYYPWFDWLRIVLAMTVVLVHDKVIRWHNAANLAVQVFFALSGWLIGGILLETKVGGVPRFYFNRVTRIWIPYGLALGLLLTVSAFRDTITPKYLEFVFYKITFVYNLFGTSQLSIAEFMPLHGTGNHFWSICAEEQFYLLSPLLLVVAPRRIGRSVVLWGAIAICAVAFDVYGAISVGVFATILRKQFGGWHKTLVAKVVLALLAAGATATLYLDTLPYEYVAPILSISVVLLLAGEGRKSTVGGFLGGVSYPLYLNQWVGVFAAHYLLGRFGMRESILAKILATTMSLAFASFLYVVVDTQVLTRRSAWYTRRLGWSLASAGYALILIGVVGGVMLTRH